MNPQTPNFSAPAPTPSAPSKGNHGITIAAMAIFVLLALGAVAFLYYQNQQLKTLLANYQTNSSPTPTTTPDPTLDWKTYADTKLGYSLKYPDTIFKYTNFSSGFFIATSAPQGGNDPKFLGQNDFWINITTLSAANIASIDQYLSLPNQQIFPSNSPKTPITIGGVNGYLIDFKQPVAAGNVSEQTELAIVIENGQIFSISISSWNPEVLQNNKQLFSQILSTFKFLGQGSTTSIPNWKTYIDDLGFSFSYPDNYTYSNEIVNGVQDPSRIDFETTSGTWLTLIRKNPTQYDFNNLCGSQTTVFPCIQISGWGQQAPINDITLDGKAAKSFYIESTNGPDNDYHIVTISNPSVELRMYVSGGGLDKTFQQILSTFKSTQ